jgi:hypothetical protein
MTANRDLDDDGVIDEDEEEEVPRRASPIRLILLILLALVGLCVLCFLGSRLLGNNLLSALPIQIPGVSPGEPVLPAPTDALETPVLAPTDALAQLPKEQLKLQRLRQSRGQLNQQPQMSWPPPFNTLLTNLWALRSLLELKNRERLKNLEQRKSR